MNNYETVLILNPVLSEEQVKESMDKFKNLLASFKAECTFEELWGLKKMKYSIQNRKTGFYMLFQFKSSPEVVSDLEVELKRDERIMRFLTVKMDKHAMAFADRRRSKLKSKAEVK
tara:strand:+ start:574 stop:921 length:348 start_codon:yes stop_codon:yes gene_type:complete